MFSDKHLVGTKVLQTIPLTMDRRISHSNHIPPYVYARKNMHINREVFRV